MSDLIDRNKAIKMAEKVIDGKASAKAWTILAQLKELPSAQPEEVIPHRHYKHLLKYWCKCGWYLGEKGGVKYCAECGRKVNWDG